MEKRISGGFDLRVRMGLQDNDLRQRDQYLIPDKRIPISADLWIWARPDEVGDFMLKDPESYPMGLRKSLDDLFIGLHKRGIATTNLSPVCLTISEATVASLSRQFGAEYFEGAPTEEGLLSRGWRFLGLDVVELNGLTSGLKGIGYKEPTWSQLRAQFGSALNEVGLFSDEMIASKFAEVRGREVPAHAPFDVVGLLVRNPIEP